jgi:hypothetical protein
MKKFFAVLGLVLILGLFTKESTAVPIYKNGKYVRLDDTPSGFTFKCTWQFWQECYMYDSDGPIIIFGDGTICDPCYMFSVGQIQEGDGTTSDKYEAVTVN